MGCAVEEGRRIRRSLGTTDRAEAEERLRRRVRPPLRIVKALDLWTAHASVRRSPKTNATALGYLRAALTAMRLEHVDELVPAAISDLLTARAREGRAPKTLNHIRAELGSFCRWLVERDELRENPVDRVRAFSMPAPTIRYLGLEEVHAMRQAIEGDAVEPIALCLLWAGLRRGEAVWLDWADVDLDRGLLAIRGKPGWQPKTRRNRTVPIAPKLRWVLEVLDMRRRAAWVFPSPHGHRWDPDNLSARFRDRMQKAGLDWTLADLRRTFGSHVIRRAGMSYARLAAIMGNSAAICARHYAHVAPEETAVQDVTF